MLNVTYYEWIVEELEANGFADPDIYDTHAFDNAIEAATFAKGCTLPVRLGVTRNRGNEVEGLVDRQWAYPDETTGQLPERFDWGGGETGGAKVPTSVHRMWRIWCKDLPRAA